MKTVDALSRCHLCAGLAPAEVEAVSRITSLRTVQDGELLFQEGDPARGFYVLLAGRIRIFKSSADGKEHTLHIIRPGQMFAEVAIFHDGMFPAHAVAVEDSTVAFFPKPDFLRLLGESPQISLKIIGSLAAFVREFNRQIEDLSLKDVPSRLAGYFLDECRRTGRTVFRLETTKLELARRLGTISETLSRNLRKFSELGLIEVRQREITVLQPDRLEDIAGGLEKL